MVNYPIDKRDFDANRPLLQDTSIDQDGSPGSTRRPGSQLSRTSLPRGDDGLLNDVVDEIVERDRRRMHKELIRVISFGWGVVTWFVNPI